MVSKQAAKLRKLMIYVYLYQLKVSAEDQLAGLFFPGRAMSWVHRALNDLVKREYLRSHAGFYNAKLTTFYTLGRKGLDEIGSTYQLYPKESAAWKKKRQRIAHQDPKLVDHQIALGSVVCQVLLDSGDYTLYSPIYRDGRMQYASLNGRIHYLAPDFTIEKGETDQWAWVNGHRDPKRDWYWIELDTGSMNATKLAEKFSNYNAYLHSDAGRWQPGMGKRVLAIACLTAQDNAAFLIRLKTVRQQIEKQLQELGSGLTVGDNMCAEQNFPPLELLSGRADALAQYLHEDLFADIHPDIRVARRIEQAAKEQGYPIKLRTSLPSAQKAYQGRAALSISFNKNFEIRALVIDFRYRSLLAQKKPLIDACARQAFAKPIRTLFMLRQDDLACFPVIPNTLVCIEEWMANQPLEDAILYASTQDGQTRFVPLSQLPAWRESMSGV